MGLDITVYRDLKPAVKSSEDTISLLNNEHCKRNSAGIMEGNYTGEHQFSFRGGSYGGYNKWRSQLEELAAGNEEFDELINFTDCDGFISTEVSKKLGKDFEENMEKAVEFSLKIENPWFIYRYCLFMKAFIDASYDGIVLFH